MAVPQIPSPGYGRPAAPGTVAAAEAFSRRQRAGSFIELDARRPTALHVSADASRRTTRPPGRLAYSAAPCAQLHEEYHDDSH